MEYEVGSHPWGSRRGCPLRPGWGLKGDNALNSRWVLSHGDKARGSSVNGMGYELEVSLWRQSKHTLCAQDEV